MQSWFVVPSALFMQAGLTFAAAVPGNSINVSYRWESNGLSQEISAFGSGGVLLGSACSNAFNEGSFSTMPISINLQTPPSALGNISIGDTAFALTSNPDDSSSPRCQRAYSNTAVEVQCTVIMGSAIRIDSSAEAVAADCLGATSDALAFSPGKLDMLRAGNLTGTELSPRGSGPEDESRDLTKRQCSSFTTTQRVGDGNPFQHYKHQQLSNNLECGNAIGCHIEVGQSDATTFGFTTSLSKATFITGGFAVSKTFTETETQVCDGQRRETVCIWFKTAYTAYDVERVKTTCCAYGGNCFDTDLGQGIMKSPNKNNKGSNPYCVVGANNCRHKSASYWNNNGRPGGP